jgi:deazaflavin-dependent oxidoreductase (nitroreductase family)
MLTTTGARSGLSRTVVLLGLPDGDRVVVIASNYGQRHHPAWYHNLRANPRAVLTVAGRTIDIRARMLAGEERERWFRRGVEINPGWVQYRQRAANREIPVIMLEPVGPEPNGPGGPG